MYETGKTVQVAREMKRYKIRVLGLCETRWIQSGQLRLSSGEQLLYSWHIEEGAPHTEGVALMLAPEAHAALIGWEPVSSRIITAKFTTKKKDIRLNIIQCYAPTNDAEEGKKDDFYQQLQAVLDRKGTKDITILMGDFNAKIGMDNTGYEDFMGTQWEHCKKLWQDICEEVLGKKKTQNKEWISADTIHKLETRRERKTVLNNSRTRTAKARAQEEYTAVDREVKRSIKKDKRDYIDDLARQAETAAGLGNLRDLYLVTKKLTGNFQ